MDSDLFAERALIEVSRTQRETAIRTAPIPTLQAMMRDRIITVRAYLDEIKRRRNPKL